MADSGTQVAVESHLQLKCEDDSEGQDDSDVE